MDFGSKQFDPVKVGYVTSQIEGGYMSDTTDAKQHNKGHEFKGGPRGKGVIGSTLSREGTARALIEDI